ncbi:DUF485 domain-containing protein [Streptomyces sp. MS06]|uniref:DUF485 domain-containing protein n=1 Tax=Streptomyces sp. MS06 TaxID=3385974 RepID=UPI0039A0A1EC
MSYDSSPSYPEPTAHPPGPPYRRPSPPPQGHPWQPTPPAPRQPHREQYREQHREQLVHPGDLRSLRQAYQRQRRTTTLTALGYFSLFLLLSAFVPSFMTLTVADGLPIGLLLALLQLPVTWTAIVLYERTARHRVDPLADRIRRQVELDARREAAR